MKSISLRHRLESRGQPEVKTLGLRTIVIICLNRWNIPPLYRNTFQKNGAYELGRRSAKAGRLGATSHVQPDVAIGLRVRQSCPGLALYPFSPSFSHHTINQIEIYVKETARDFPDMRPQVQWRLSGCYWM